MPIEQPKSNFDRWQDRENDMDESHKTGKDSYIKGENRNGKNKK
jgi:hypothetical protein